jgi:cysteine synthase
MSGKGSRVHGNLLDRIGNTPLVRFDNLDLDPHVAIWGKLELCNPSGSIKDRIALRMIAGAEERGELTSDMTIIEATSGNTGISLGMVSTIKGYRCNLFMSEGKSIERRMLLRYWGCDLTLTDADDHDSAILAAQALDASGRDDIFYINQNENPDNVAAHREGTGREIVTALEGQVDAVVAGFGTGGTLMGCAQALRDAGLKGRIISVEPAVDESQIDGIMRSNVGYMPTIFEADLVDEMVAVKDGDAFAAARLLALREGLMAGISSGANLHAALELAKRMKRGNIVIIIADRAERYFSTPLFDEARERP